MADDQETIDEMTKAAANADDTTLSEILSRTVNKPNKYGRTAIQVVNRMSPSTVRILLQHGADPNVPDPDVLRTILHDIAESGCLSILELLLDHGADATARDNQGNTPAHLAARQGGQSRIEILERLSQSCTLYEVNTAGETPLDLATQNDHGDIIIWLQNLCRQPLPLLFLARRTIRMRVRIVQNLQHLDLPSLLIDYLIGR